MGFCLPSGGGCCGKPWGGQWQRSGGFKAAQQQAFPFPIQTSSSPLPKMCCLRGCELCYFLYLLLRLLWCWCVKQLRQLPWELVKYLKVGVPWLVSRERRVRPLPSRSLFAWPAVEWVWRLGEVLGEPPPRSPAKHRPQQREAGAWLRSYHHRPRGWPSEAASPGRAACIPLPRHWAACFLPGADRAVAHSEGCREWKQII